MKSRLVELFDDFWQEGWILRVLVKGSMGVWVANFLNLVFIYGMIRGFWEVGRPWAK